MYFYLFLFVLIFCGCETVGDDGAAEDEIRSFGCSARLTLADLLLAEKPPVSDFDADHLRKCLRRRVRIGDVIAKAWPITPRLVALQTDARGLPPSIAEQEKADRLKRYAIERTCFEFDLDISTRNSDKAQTKSFAAKLNLGAGKVVDLIFENPSGEAEPINKKHKEWKNHDVACAATYVDLRTGFQVVLIPAQQTASSLVLDWRDKIVAH